MKKSSEHYSGNEVKRYLGALHEEHMAGLKAMGEQFLDINRKLDSHTEMLNSHTEMLNSHTEMIGGLAIRMTSMETKMTMMQEDIEFIKSGMKRKVDQDEFDALLRRVSVLERRVLK